MLKGEIIRRLLIALGISTLSISALSLPALAACENGMEETLISPAEIEYGTIAHKIYVKSLATQARVMPAIWKVMTQAEYDALPYPGLYQRRVYFPAKLIKTPIDLMRGEVSEFDYVYWPDGTVATRKIKANILRHVENDELLETVKTKSVETEFTRADPIRLPDGNLKVMISPPHKTPIIMSGRVVDAKRKYVKSRTPAKYQLSFCEN